MTITGHAPLVPRVSQIDTLMRSAVVAAVSVLTACLVVLGISSPAQAGVAPTVSSLSVHAGPYWGGRVVTVHGSNFTDVRDVQFGSTSGWSVRTVSPSTITVVAPYHSYGSVHVRVVTASGRSRMTQAAMFTFRKPTMNEPIQGGMTGTQEQRVSARVRGAHRSVALARRSSHWTAAIGLSAARRAQSWLGLPYSWAGGNATGPTTGVCAHNGGDLDCHVVGFDCSGLTLYSWAPYKTMAHYAATQRSAAGRFHPGLGELVPGDLVFFSGYLADSIGHVAIYTGGGMVVEAPESGSTVRRSRLADLIAWDGTYRGATRPLTSGRQGSAPVVDAVTPTVATSGGTVTIVGRGLAGTTAVAVGKSVFYSFRRRTAGHVVLAVPPHAAGRATIAVSTAWGTVKRTVTYVAPAQASSLTPASGTTAGGTTVTIGGRNLPTVSQVLMGSKAVNFRHTGTTSRPTLTLAMPAHAQGPVSLTLVSRYGRSGAYRYTYVKPASPSPSPSSPSSPPVGSSSSTPATPSPSTSTPVPSPSSSTSSPSPTASTAPSSTTIAPSTTPSSTAPSRVATSATASPSSSPPSAAPSR